MILHLGHKFVENWRSDTSLCIEYKCIVCNLTSYYYVVPQIFTVNDVKNSKRVRVINDEDINYYQLAMTCEEYQIKNLLE